MKVYTYSEARRKLATILSEARREGEVRIKRRSGEDVDGVPATRLTCAGGLTECLAGRFEVLHLTDWTASEMGEALSDEIREVDRKRKSSVARRNEQQFVRYVSHDQRVDEIGIFPDWEHVGWYDRARRHEPRQGDPRSADVVISRPFAVRSSRSGRALTPCCALPLSAVDVIA